MGLLCACADGDRAPSLGLWLVGPKHPDELVLAPAPFPGACEVEEQREVLAAHEHPRCGGSIDPNFGWSEQANVDHNPPADSEQRSANAARRALSARAA